MILHSWNILLADAAAPAAASQPSSILSFVPFILMFVVLYFIMIRPQSKKAKEHAAMLKTVRPGDKVVTSSGIVGIVVSVKDKTLAIRSADTKLEVLKSAVSEITERSGESKPEES
ncbi:MAG: yajC [Pedosphaera sp.]|nr:yajC [Pedosphaera sp.]